MPEKKTYLRVKNGIYHYYRRVPADVRHIDRRVYVEKSLKTDSPTEAEKRCVALNAETERFWDACREANSVEAASTARERYEKAVRTVRKFGLSYVPMQELAEGDFGDLAARIDLASGKGGGAAAALLGGVQQPDLTYPEAFAEYQHQTRESRRGWSDKRFRKWENPRKNAINNFQTVCGADKTLPNTTRNDALAFRDWWVDRMIDEDLKGEAAVKNVRHLRAIFKTVNDALRLNLVNPFTDLTIDRMEADDVPAFTLEQLVAILSSDAVMRLNVEARWVLFMKAGTGARTTEICGLDPDNNEIVLDADIPYIDIRRNQFRDLKIKHTQRKIPLIGCALSAAKAMPRGTDMYRTNADSCSATISKMLTESGLLPTPDHVLNSARHGFQDRLTAIEAPERVEKDLMGHKLSDNRPRYGDGASLEQKLEWMLKIAVDVPFRF